MKKPWDNRFLDYNTARQEAERARSKSAGKRLDGSTRLHIDGDLLHLRVRGKRIATIRPDNSVEVFFPDAPSFYYCKWLGLVPFAAARGKTAILHVAQFPRSLRFGYEVLDKYIARKTAPPAVDGIRFDLVTGECLNPSPWLERERHADKELEWKRQLRAFKRTLKTMAKVGAFNHLFVQSWEEWYDMRGPDWTPATAEELHTLIVTGECQKVVDLLALDQGFYQGTYTISTERTTERVLNAFDTVYARHRDAVRKLAGCYSEHLPSEQIDQSLMAA